MAKLPTLGSGGVNAPQVIERPTTSPALASQSANSLRGLGESITGASLTALNISQKLEEQRRKAEILIFDSQASDKFDLDLRKISLDSENELSGTDYKGYAQGITEKAKKLKEEILKTAPSQDAANYMSLKLDRAISSEANRAYLTEQKARSEYYTGEEIRKVDSMGQVAMSDPDIFQANRRLLEYKSDASKRSGVTFFQSQYEGLMDQAGKSMRKGVFNGLSERGLAGIINPSDTPETAASKVDELLNGKLAGTEELIKGMTLDEKVTYRNRMIASANRQIELYESNLKREAKGAAEILKAGGQLSQSEENALTLLKNDMASRAGLSEELQELDNAQKMSGYLQEIKKLNPAEITNDFSKLFGEGGSFAEKSGDAKFVTQLQKSVVDIFQERNADGAKYVKENFPHISSVEESLEMQKKLGVANPRVLSKEQAALEARGILEGVTSDDKIMQLESIIDTYGANAPQALEEMSKVNSELGSEYVLAAHLSDTESKKILISKLNKKNKSDIRDLYKNATAINTSSRKEFEMQLSRTTKSMATALSNYDNQTVANGLLEAVEVEAKDLFVKSGGEGKTSLLVQQAYQNIIGNNFEFINKQTTKTVKVGDEEFTSVTGQNSIVFPKSTVKKSTAESFLNKARGKDFWNKVGITPATKAFKNFKGDDDEFYENLDDNAFWANNGSMTGLVLKYKNPMSGQVGTYMKEDGTRVEYKFKDM